MDSNVKQLGDYTVSVIRAVLNGTSVPPVPESISLRELYRFVRHQKVESLVFRGLDEQVLNQDPVLFYSWMTAADDLVQKSGNQQAERDAIIAAFQTAKIPLLPVKGCWLSALYPQAGDRYMGDLDMLIHKEQEAQAEAVMLSLGYERENENCLYHTEYNKPPHLSVELHKSLLPDSDPDYAYFDKVWGKARQDEKNPYLYRLSPEDEYLYFIAHLRKHMEEGGIGLRMVLDCHIYTHSFKLNEAYLASQLAVLGLDSLDASIREIARCWLETGEAVPDTLSELELDIFSGSPYGSMDKLIAQRMEKLGGTRWQQLFRYILPRFFRPLEEMQRKYPVLKRLPVLLPVFWVVRIVQKMIHNERGFWIHLRTLLAGGKKP